MKKCIMHEMVRGVLLLAMMLFVGCSSFQLSSVPTAEIYENGEKIGNTPYSFKLLSGARVLTLKRYGYVEEEVSVSSLDPRQMHITLQWVGSTRIETRPPGAEVIRIEDEKELGIAPCALHLSQPIRVLIKLKGYESVERDLIPNERHIVELKSKTGVKSVFYKDIMFVSEQGPIAIYDRVAGERIGVTPVRLNLEAGSALEYRLAGYKSEFALISRNGPHRVVIDLEARIQVTLSGPEGAEVYRAGGTTPLGQVPYSVEVDGNATFELKKEGYYDQQIFIYPGAPKNMKIKLEEIPYKTIVTDPPGAEVYRLGGLEKLGTAPFKTVVDGERVFEIKKEGYKTSVIGMGPSSPAQLNVPLHAAPRDDPDAAAIGSLDNSGVGSF